MKKGEKDETMKGGIKEGRKDGKNEGRKVKANSLSLLSLQCL